MKGRLQISKSTQLIGHQNPVYALATDEAEGVLYSAGNDKGIVRWNLAESKFERVLSPVEHTVYGLHLLPAEQTLIACMRSGLVRGIDTQTGESRWDLSLHQAPVFALGSLLGKGAGVEVIVASEDGTVSIWDPAKPSQPLLHLTVSDAPIRCMAVSPDERWLGFGTKDGAIHVYHAEDFSPHTVLSAHTLPVTSLLFSPDGAYLLSAARDARMVVTEIGAEAGDFTQKTDFVPHLYAIYSMQFHPDLPIFATASRDKAVKIWSAEDFRLLRSLSIEKGWDAHRLSVNALAWHPNGEQLFTTGDDKVIMVWDVKV